LNNFNAAFAIAAGLQQNPVYRLKKSWDLIKKEKDYKFFEDLQAMMSKVSNYAQYRDLLHKSNPPSIPYLGTTFQLVAH
jgi:son of sevenless-like protein